MMKLRALAFFGVTFLLLATQRWVLGGNIEYRFFMVSVMTAAAQTVLLFFWWLIVWLLLFWLPRSQIRTYLIVIVASLLWVLWPLIASVYSDPVETFNLYGFGDVMYENGRRTDHGYRVLLYSAGMKFITACAGIVLLALNNRKGNSYDNLR